MSAIRIGIRIFEIVIEMFVRLPSTDHTGSHVTACREDHPVDFIFTGPGVDLIRNVQAGTRTLLHYELAGSSRKKTRKNAGFFRRRGFGRECKRGEHGVKLISCSFKLLKTLEGIGRVVTSPLE